MPQVIVAAVAATAGAAIGGAIAGTAITTAALATTFFTTLAVGAVGMALAKKPKAPDFKQQAQGFSSMVREPAGIARAVYGRMRVSGPMVFVHTTDVNKWLHIIVPLAPHEVEAIDHIFFDDNLIMLDSNGETTDARYIVSGTPYIRVKKHLGADGQSADSDLISDAPDLWTSSHRLRGNAYIYVRLGWKEGLWPNGIPNISAIVRGKKLFDTRDSTTTYNTNAALAVYDYLTNSTYGMNVPAAEIDTDSFDTAANVCDESVTITQAYAVEYPSAITASTELATKNSVESVLDHNNATRWTTSTATNEYIDLTFPSAVDLTRIKLQSPSELQGLEAPTSWTLYGSNTGAFSGEETSVTSASSQSWDAGETKTYSFSNGTSYLYYRLEMTTTTKPNISLTQIEMFSSTTSENRYTANGVADTANTPKDVLTAMVSAMAGILVYQNGKWFIYSGEYRTPTVSLDETDLRGPINMTTLISRKELFNTVKGVYVDPAQGFQPMDFPEVTNSTYVTEDNSDIIIHDTSYPFTTSGATAQRLAKIELESVRQQIRITIPLKMTGFQLQVGDTFQFSNTRFGWTDKVFAVEGWTFALDKGENGELVPGVNIVAKETASSVYTWSTEETTVDPAPNTSLPNPFNIGAPANFTFTTGDDYLFQRADGTVASFAKLSWAATTDIFISNGGKYEIDAKLTAVPSGRSTSTTDLGSYVRVAELEGSASSLSLFNLQEGATYSFRIRAVNAQNTRSAFTEITGKVMNAKAAPPSDISTFIVSQVDDQLHFKWNSLADVDLKEYEIRYGPDANTNWKDATPLGRSLTNSATLTVVPGTWSYFIKAKDTIGNYSNNAKIATVSVVNVNNVIESIIDTDFTAGTTSQMVRHYTGALTAQDENTASFYGWSTFDLFIPTPKSTGSYTTADIDIDFDDTVRVWGAIQSELGPGVGTGVADPEFNILFLLDGQSGQLNNNDGESITSTGTLTNMVLDYRGNLTPASQNLASADGFSTFDVFVPNPYPAPEYEADEIDVSADRSLVFDTDITEELGPGETGATTADIQIDYRKDADSYDGFESWTSGRIEAQHIKHKFVLNTANGVTVIRNFTHNIDGFEPWIIGEKTGRTFTGRIDADYTEGNFVIRQLDFYTDKKDNFQQAQDVNIGSGGTTITFGSEYHNTPRIKVDPQGTSAINYAISSKSGSSFHVKLFNSSGTGVSGTVDWESRGA